MGAGHNLGHGSKHQIRDEYLETFKMNQNHPQNLSKMLHEVPNFGKNLIKLFPYCTASYSKYAEMVQFLRRYDPQIHDNLEAKEIAKNTSTIDRFFMVCLGIVNYEEYNNKILSNQEAQQLLMNYLRIFIANPKKGNIQKVLKYINMRQFKDKINPKMFGEKLRQGFPHIQQFLKNYIITKFSHGEKTVHLLKDIKSQVLNDDAIFLALKIPKLVSGHTTLLYSSHIHGFSFHSIQKRLLGYTGPWLLLINHVQKNQKGQKVEYVFGSYQNGPIKDTNVTQGDLTGFIFTIEPKIKFLTTDKGQGGQNYFFINNLNEQISKKRKGIGFGGDNNRNNCKLWIDSDIDKSKVFNGNDKTYGFGSIASKVTDTLSIRSMQIWGLGNIQNLKQQQKYWAERQSEVQKRRKVNKKEFVDGNAGMFMENTFAHRDQVYGEMDWQKKEQDKI